MGFIRKLFGSKETRKPGKDEVVFHRTSLSPVEATPGTERQTFVREVAMVLECEPSGVNIEARLVEDLGCADLDVSECVQIAEEIWGVQLMPNPMKMSDFAKMMKSFPTLQSIIIAAEAKRSYP